jgi:hypothetical protein
VKNDLLNNLNSLRKTQNGKRCLQILGLQAKAQGGASVSTIGILFIEIITYT